MLLGALLAPLVLAITGWSVGVLYYATPADPRVRAALVMVFVVVVTVAFLRLPGRRALAGLLVVFGVVLAGWSGIRPSNDRDWQSEVSVTPWASLAGDLVTIHGVRNFDYRTETDFDHRWETRTYDLRALDTVDLVAVYWAGKAIVTSW
jgi:hypothetical protein